MLTGPSRHEPRLVGNLACLWPEVICGTCLFEEISPNPLFLNRPNSLSGITSGRAHLADAHTGGRPEDAESWGWRGSDPQGELVGWLDGANLLLEPDAAFAVAQRLARDQGGGIAITPRTLWRRMADRGLLESREAGRNLKYWTIQNRRPRVLHLLVETLRQ